MPSRPHATPAPGRTDAPAPPDPAANQAVASKLVEAAYHACAGMDRDQRGHTYRVCTTLLEAVIVRTLLLSPDQQRATLRAAGAELRRISGSLLTRDDS